MNIIASLTARIEEYRAFSVQDMPSIEGRPAVRGYNVVRRSDNKNMACFYDYDLAVARANILNGMAKSRAQQAEVAKA